MNNHEISIRINNRLFIGEYEYDREDDYFYGKVINVYPDVITFGGENEFNCIQDFKDAIEDYLDFCLVLKAEQN